MDLATTRAAGVIGSFVVIGIGAGALAGWSASSAPSSQFLQERVEIAAAASIEPQSSNTTAKGDRLSLALPEAPPATYSLASISPDAAPASPGAAAAAAPNSRNVAAVRLPPEKPKSLSALPSNGLLDEAQIAAIKNRLKLTPEQEEYWPAIASALRDVIRQQAREARKRGSHAGAPPIDVNSEEVQRLTWAAVPLLMRLREDQKREVRTLARVMGLEAVASQI
jgi:hypothetical protein